MPKTEMKEEYLKEYAGYKIGDVVERVNCACHDHEIVPLGTISKIEKIIKVNKGHYRKKPGVYAVLESHGTVLNDFENIKKTNDDKDLQMTLVKVIKELGG